jgi:hypothetical protein
MKELDSQISFVVEAVPRILKQIDMDPLSPTFGCAHLGYWRDKTSEVADMRRQEVMLPLALLYSFDYPGSSWKGNGLLPDAMEALLSFWCENRYTDGSLDEWYKGERAFAAAAFSTHAVARTLSIMENILPEPKIVLAKEKLEKTAHWLTGRDDLFKTNHQAVGVAALACAGKVLQNDLFTKNARKKLQSIIDVQTTEGWFPEVGHMDVGYTFLTIEFVLMTMELWNDRRLIEAFQRAFDFACEWIHPNLTVGDEYGVCHNPYLSRIAVILLSATSGHAAYLRHRFEKEAIGFKGYSSVFADDLRLLRWAYQPLLAYDYAKKTASPAEHEAIPLANPGGKIRFYENAALGRFSCCGCTGVFAPAAGGLIRLFGMAAGKSFSDYGYAIKSGYGYASNQTYNRKIEVHQDGEDILIVCSISPVKKFMPPFWARVVLRLACSTATGSRLTRKGIDIIRKRKGTALNQSSANLSSSKSLWTLQRRISFRKDHLLVTDKLLFAKPVKQQAIFFLESTDDNLTKCRPLISNVQKQKMEMTNLQITKCYQPGDNWSLAETNVNHEKET